MATSTRKTYGAGIRKFVKFCDQHHACPLPAQKETVAYFAVAMTRELTPSTIRVYLSAVTVMHRIAGFSDPTRHNYLLKLVLKGAKRIHSLQPTRKREPITVQILAKLLSQIRHTRSLQRKDRHMLAAAFTLAFFGLLRVSEFTVPSLREFDPRIHATNGSIHFSRNHYTFHLSRSKTDQYGHGYDVYIPQIGGKLCPHAAMINYLTEQGQTMQAAPLFVFTSGKPLTRNSCLKHLHHALGRIGYDPKNFNTHSFRIGAATSASHAGISTSVIKVLGRWRSDAYRRYTRSHRHAIKVAAAKLANLASTELHMS